MPKILKRVFGQATPPLESTPPDAGALAPLESGGASASGDAGPPGEPAVAALRLLRVVEETECQLQELRDAWRRRWEQDAVRLACRIAARCLRELPFDSAELAARLTAESLRGVRLQGGCEVRLHPDDYHALSNAGRLPSGDVVVLPDSTVSPGGCVVKTPDGEINQTLEAQLQRVERELTDL